MKIVVNIIVIAALSFVLAIAQFFVTGLYGKITIIPIFIGLVAISYFKQRDRWKLR